MPKALSDAQIAGFRRDGFVHPIDGIEPELANAAVACLDSYERETGTKAQATRLQVASAVQALLRHHRGQTTPRRA